MDLHDNTDRSPRTVAEQASHGFVIDALWSPPANRGEAAMMINELSHDITLILAQLAESAQDWCARTGRAEQDHARWRRRALFAKAHKENQLRECKRLRQAFAAEDASRPAATADGASDFEYLHRLCQCVVNAWDHRSDSAASSGLDRALAALADYVHGAEGMSHTAEEWSLSGVRATAALPAS